MADADCPAAQVCSEGACAEPVVTAECTAGQSRPWGNEAVGACLRGTQRCVDGKFETACTGEVRPTTETCNAVDDDCDGETDEGVSTSWSPDADGDGAGASAGVAVTACVRPQGYADNALDCDDRPGAGAAINRNATEVCNGVDDDCDGQTDEGVGTSWYPDADGDGAGASAGTPVTACVRPQGYADNALDCDDRPGVGASINRSAPEACEAQGVDENCNGTVNEGCGCPVPGATQPCCGGRGTQTCQAIPTGSTLSMCNASIGLELCNGVDDDCDGQIDEQAQVGSPDGGLLPDGGADDGSCTVGVGVCARPGSGVCTAGSVMCVGDAGTPSLEQCNGLDDDCDGQIDDQAQLGLPDGGTIPLSGGGVANGDGTCRVGVGTCSRTGATSCAAGSLTCSATAGSPATEVCNTRDDDCDGTVDEEGPGLCLVSGQLCSSRGFCACPIGQSVCNGACAVVSTEVCDGVDNDCDGQTDEGLLMACYGDPDGDLYASNTTVVLRCPDSSRPSAGFCPARFVAPANSLALDCNPANGALYRQVSSRNDADNDTLCTGGASNDCVGVSALPGRRFTSACNVSDDCNDNNPSLYRLMNSRTDADADGHCVGAVTADCAGAVALPGRRFEAACTLPDDCNDGNGSLFRNASVRTDGDDDMYCTGTAQTMCIGSSPPAGLRLTSNCMGEDCRDTNRHATAACTLYGGWTTSPRTSTCPSNTTTSTLTVLSTCPLGFFLGSYWAVISAGGGSCSAYSPSQITQSCNFLEGTTCRVVGDCVAQ